MARTPVRPFTGASLPRLLVSCSTPHFLLFSWREAAGAVIILIILSSLSDGTIPVGSPRAPPASAGADSDGAARRGGTPRYLHRAGRRCCCAEGFRSCVRRAGLAPASR